jgi:hypothetical protein
MDIKITKASGNDITLVVTPLANQKIIIDRNIKGDTGATGATGAGVATGGTTGQVLAKVNATDYNTTWVTPNAGTVTSVGGTGSVNGILLSGAITSSGNLTLGGALTGISNSQLTNSSITINGSAIALGGTVSTPQGTVTGVTGTSPIVSSGGTTPAISIPASNTTISGYLTSTDWNIFNNKLSSQVYPSAGIPNSTGTAWGTSYSTSGSGSVLALSDSPIFTTAITATGALQLAGSSTVTQNIATSQSTSILNIGGSYGSGAINIGRSSTSQTISIGSGLLLSGNIRTINIGTNTTNSNAVSNINIGKYSGIATNTLNLNGNTINLLADTISIQNLGALSIGSNLLQTAIFTADLVVLTGVSLGSRSFVIDAYQPIFGSIVVDGGSTGTPVPVYYDGTNWRVG